MIITIFWIFCIVIGSFLFLAFFKSDGFFIPAAVLLLILGISVLTDGIDYQSGQIEEKEYLYNSDNQTNFSVNNITYNYDNSTKDIYNTTFGLIFILISIWLLFFTSKKEKHEFGDFKWDNKI